MNIVGIYRSTRARHEKVVVPTHNINLMPGDSLNISWSERHLTVVRVTALMPCVLTPKMLAYLTERLDTLGPAGVRMLIAAGHLWRGYYRPPEHRAWDHYLKVEILESAA